MMADFVGNHVGLGEVPRGLEPLAQITVESKVDINFLIFAAVKGPAAACAKPQADSTASEKSTKVVSGIRSLAAGKISLQSARCCRAPARRTGASRHFRRVVETVAPEPVGKLASCTLPCSSILGSNPKEERQQDDYEGADPAACDPA